MAATYKWRCPGYDPRWQQVFFCPDDKRLQAQRVKEDWTDVLFKCKHPGPPWRDILVTSGTLLPEDFRSGGRGRSRTDDSGTWWRTRDEWRPGCRPRGLWKVRRCRVVVDGCDGCGCCASFSVLNSVGRQPCPVCAIQIRRNLKLNWVFNLF